MSFFCKVEDSKKNQYILTDKNKQALIAHPFKNTCIIPNGKKFLNNPELLLLTFKEIAETNKIINNNEKSVFESSLFVDTKIPYRNKNGDINNIVKKSDIDFNIYDIATFNKDIVIKDETNKQYSEIELESRYLILHSSDINNKDYYEKMRQKREELQSKGVMEPPLNIVSEHITELYNYYQKLLIKKEYNNCIISDWTQCNSTNSTQTRTRTQATIIGTDCTPDENNLPLTQTCNNCIISDWTQCNSTNSTRTRTRTQALNSTACTPDENNLPLTQSCNNCIISDWTPCDDTKLTQTRTRTQALNSTACTPDENNLPLTQSCLSTIKESSKYNNMYIGIGIFVFFIFAIALGFYIFKQKPKPNY